MTQMRSGLRGGKPRDMATFKHGGTSRGAGAAKKGFDYAVYKKGGKVKKYADGGALRDKSGDYERDPLTGTRQYASFGDLMGDLFGKKKVPASALDETNMRAARARTPELVEDREISRPAPARKSLPTAPQRRMARRRAAMAPRPRAGIGGAGIDPERYVSPEAEMRSMYPPRPVDLTRPEYHPDSAYEPYRKGGKVKMAGGGSCRGMGAATRGGKYTIK